MKIVMYSTGCPKCNVLKSKLNAKSLQYEVVTDIEQMKALGFKSAPKLVVDGTTMDFADAVKWVSAQ